MSADTEPLKPARFGFLLLDNFTLISMSAAIESLRLANRVSQLDHFSWRLISTGAEAVSASDGVTIRVDTTIDDAAAFDAIDAVVVCGGVRIRDVCEERVLRWLRLANKNGVALCAICTGSYVLARAGLLDGYHCSIHWANTAALEETFPQVLVSRALFTIDRDRMTCSGGTAPIDMMLNLIGGQLGHETAAAVADQMICDRIRRADDEQRVPIRHLSGVQSTKLQVAVELMEANLKEPLDQSELAQYIGLSRRQLQRLFAHHLNCSPSRYYLRLRLQRARSLLRQSGLSVLEISSICGFISTSHFSKSYKEQFGYSPSRERSARA